MLIFPLSFPKLTNFNKCQGISDSTYIIQEKHASLPPNLFKISKYTYKSWDMTQKSQLATLPLKLLTTLQCWRHTKQEHAHQSCTQWVPCAPGTRRELRGLGGGPGPGPPTPHSAGGGQEAAAGIRHRLRSANQRQATRAAAPTPTPPSPPWKATLAWASEAETGMDTLRMPAGSTPGSGASLSCLSAPATSRQEVSLGLGLAISFSHGVAAQMTPPPSSLP